MEMESVMKGKHVNLLPTQILALGFAVMILVGTLLLSLPIASANGQSMGFLNALFEATSAVCVTGLAVVNTAYDLSIFGQIIIILLIQMGGLGFMTMAAMVFLLMGKKITLKERLIMQEALNHFSLEGVVSLTKTVISTTFIIEGIGALLLALRFIPMLGWAKGIYFSIFHSISAFCNAGFDLFGNSLMDFTGDIIINFTIMGLIILGGLGFTVITDIRRKRFNFRRWSFHTKLVIIGTSILIVSGFVFYFVVEFNNMLKPYKFPTKILTALFQSVTTRTAGFYTIPQEGLTPASKLFTSILMFIGASPASTGGGIKTTTVVVILLMLKSVAKGKNDVEAFERRISMETVYRAVSIFLISIAGLVLVTTIISIVEDINFIDLLYEAASALGTVGLATFDNAELKTISKIFIIISMYMGRVGPLTLTVAFARLQLRKKSAVRYPEGKVMVG